MTFYPIILNGEAGSRHSRATVDRRRRALNPGERGAGMIRRIKQWLCARKGHPCGCRTVPFAGERPQEPDYEVTYCKGCGAVLEQVWTDNAGMGRR